MTSETIYAILSSNPVDEIYNELTKYTNQNNRYFKCYVDLCKRGQARLNKKNGQSTHGYIETHHIVPVQFNKSLEKCKNNKTFLTAREHFIAHKCLIRCAQSSYKFKAKRAVSFFIQNNTLQHRILSQRDYEYVRKVCREAMTGVENPRHGKPGTVLGKSCITNGTSNRFISNDESPPADWKYGSFFSGFKVYTDGEISLYLLDNDVVPPGFKLGTQTKGKPKKNVEGYKVPCTAEKKKKISESNKGFNWYTNGVTDLRIKSPDEIPAGFYFGRSEGSLQNKVKEEYINESLKRFGANSELELKRMLTEDRDSGMSISDVRRKYENSKKKNINHPNIVFFINKFGITLSKSRPGPKCTKKITS